MDLNLSSAPYLFLLSKTKRLDLYQKVLFYRLSSTSSTALKNQLLDISSYLEMKFGFIVMTSTNPSGS